MLTATYSGRLLLRYCGRSQTRLKNNRKMTSIGRNLNALTTSQVPPPTSLEALSLVFLAVVPP